MCRHVMLTNGGIKAVKTFFMFISNGRRDDVAPQGRVSERSSVGVCFVAQTDMRL